MKYNSSLITKGLSTFVHGSWSEECGGGSVTVDTVAVIVDPDTDTSAERLVDIGGVEENEDEDEEDILLEKKTKFQRDSLAKVTPWLAAHRTTVDSTCVSPIFVVELVRHHVAAVPRGYKYSVTLCLMLIKTE